VPSDKRARQRAAREARLIAEAKAKKNRQRLRNGGIVVVVAALIVGIAFLVSGNSPKKPVSALSAVSKGKVTTTTAAASGGSSTQKAANAIAVKAGCPASTSARVNTQSYPSAPALTIDPNKLYSATIVTTAGTVNMALFAKAAPTTVNSFVFLANKGYFHCVIFHRVIPGFVDQTGDPTGTGTGGPGYKFANENVPKAYATGDVAMANSGANTNGSQFFFLVPGGATQLDADLSSGGYSLFGQVTSGLNIIEKINAEGTSAGTPSVTQRILSVTIHVATGL
jgi:cyclophilin family peptidyl-prolyl cis-trans isomerase